MPSNGITDSESRSLFSKERWSRFRPSGGHYLAEIDGLRFVAILAVILFHTSGIWTTDVARKYPQMGALEILFQRTTKLGRFGVHLFFVISGFVLAMPFLKHAIGESPRVSLRSYFLRRLSRLEPPYVLSMLAFFALLPLIGRGSYESLTPNLIASLLYCHNVVYNAGSVLNNNAWSLEVEVQFYLAVPLMLIPTGNFPALRRLIMTGLTVVSALHPIWLPDTFPSTLIQYFQYFAIGILLCDLWLLEWRTAAQSRTWDVIGAASVLTFFLLNLFLPGTLTKLSNPWLIGAFVASALRGPGLRRVLTLGWIPIIGGMCYSIYLLHARVVSVLLHGAFARVGLSGNFIADFAILCSVIVPTTFAACAGYFALIERPCMDPSWPARLKSNWQATRPVAT